MLERAESNKKSGPEQESSVLRYLIDKNKTLINDYGDPAGNYTESCGEIAKDIARMLLQERRLPSIVSVRGKRVAEGSVNTKPLSPVRYGGRVKWGAHIVCVCDGLVYDPMIGKPLPLEAYAHEAFGADVEMETEIPENKITEFVKNRSIATEGQASTPAHE